VKSEPALGKTHIGPTPNSQSPTSFAGGETSWSSTMSPNAVVRSTREKSFGFGCGWDTKRGMTASS